MHGSIDPDQCHPSVHSVIQEQGEIGLLGLGPCAVFGGSLSDLYGTAAVNK